jgi:RNA-directed DNA polymerase
MTNNEILMYDDSTIVTTYGFVSPMIDSENPAYTSRSQGKIPSFFLESDKNRELLRQITSLKMFKDKNKEIPESSFFFNKWDLERYRKADISEFANSIKFMIREKTGSGYKRVNWDRLNDPDKKERRFVVRTVGNDIVVAGYRKHDFSPSSFSADEIKVSRENIENLRLREGEDDVAWARRGEVTSSYMAGVNSDRDESGIEFELISPFTISVYRAENLEERRIIERMLVSGTAAAIIECVVVARRYMARGEDMYDHFTIKQPQKIREIHAPKEDVKKALKHLLVPLSKAYSVRMYNDAMQFAYMPGLSIKKNAAVHANYEYSLKCDISKFFDDCKWNLAYKYMEFLVNDAYNDEIIDALKEMMINPKTGGLYQGSPVSGMLSNAIMRPSAKYLANIFDQEGMAFSIYADDITISSDSPIDVKNVLGKIQYVINEYYGLPFRINPKKTKLVKKNGRKITGVRINHKNELTIPRVKYMFLKSVLNRLKYGKKISIGKMELQGLLSYAKFIDDSGKIDRLILKYADTLKANKIRVPKVDEKQLDMDQMEEMFEREMEER